MKIREVAYVILQEKIRRRTEKRAAQLKRVLALAAPAVRRMAAGAKHHEEAKPKPYTPPRMTMSRT